MTNLKNTVTAKDSVNIFQGGGEMGALMSAYDWDHHPLGNPSQWPHSLRANIRLILNSEFPMFIWWSEELYLFHNDAYLPALGKKHPEALGASARIVWKEIWGDIGEVTENILRHGKGFYTENMLLYLERKGFSEETYWTFSYSPAFDDEGNVGGLFCACNEVSDTVQGQRRLHTLKETSEAMSRVYSLQQATQEICDILVRNPNDVPYCLIYLMDGNGTKATLTGKAGGIDPKNCPEIIDLSNLDKAEDCPLARAIQTRQPIVLDNFLPEGADAAAHPRLDKAVIFPILRADHEQVIGFFTAGINPALEYTSNYQNFHKLITGQIANSIISIQARESVLKQRESLNAMFQQAPVGITILQGPNYIIDIANPGVCEIWGRRQEDILGMSVLDALPEVREQGIKELLDGVYNTGVPFVANELPVSFKRNDKLEEVFLNFVYHPVRDAHGVITGIIAVAIDINEQVAARREIEAINRELLAINADLDNFVYSASHDLKAPISNIEGLMHALTDYIPQATLENDMVQQLMQLINSSIERFKKALSDLTEVAKIQREAGDDVIHANVGNVVREVLLDFDSTIREEGATVETDLHEEAAVHFSAKNIRSIVYNLLSNALKYKAPDRTPHIHISTETTPEFLILSVTDNGLGIDMADEAKIFSMFKRLHDHVEGSGIGLYIVKRIVENAGGRIEVQSRLGEGSTFRIHFKR